MKNTNISVVIPTCDRPDYLKETVDSVLNQTYHACEIIIIDNGYEPVDISVFSEHETVRVIRALPRFGVAQARNLGAILATGDYVAFLDDDDAWDSQYLMSVSRTAAETDSDIILGRLSDMETHQPIAGKQAEFDSETDLIKNILKRNPGVVGSNSIFKRSCFNLTAGYDPYITTNEDKAVALKMLLNGAKATRADDAWVRFRSDGVGPRLTDLSKRVEGKHRFYKVFKKEMTVFERFFNLAQTFRLWISFKLKV